MLAALLIAAEIGFWIFVVAGLAARYAFDRARLGTVLLAATPVIDLLLLVAAAADLARGGEAAPAHGLAAVYVGVSIAFGPRIIAWADRRLGPRLQGKAPPAAPRLEGADHARQERAAWVRHLVAYLIGAGLLALAIALVGDAERTRALLGTLQAWSLILVIDFLWSFSYTLWPRREGDLRA